MNWSLAQQPTVVPAVLHRLCLQFPLIRKAQGGGHGSGVPESRWTNACVDRGGKTCSWWVSVHISGDISRSKYPHVPVARVHRIFGAKLSRHYPGLLLTMTAPSKEYTVLEREWMIRSLVLTHPLEEFPNPFHSVWNSFVAERKVPNVKNGNRFFKRDWSDTRRNTAAKIRIEKYVGEDVETERRNLMVITSLYLC